MNNELFLERKCRHSTHYHDYHPCHYHDYPCSNTCFSCIYSRVMILLWSLAFHQKKTISMWLIRSSPEANFCVGTVPKSDNKRYLVPEGWGRARKVCSCKLLPLYMVCYSFIGETHNRINLNLPLLKFYLLQIFSIGVKISKDILGLLVLVFLFVCRICSATLKPRHLSWSFYFLYVLGITNLHIINNTLVSISSELWNKTDI